MGFQLVRGTTRINATTSGEHYDSPVAALDDGTDVRGQKYTADGAKIGSDFLLSQNHDGSQFEANITGASAETFRRIYDSEVFDGDSQSDILHGGSASDDFDGGAGIDNLYGEDGDDDLGGGDGSDLLEGNRGDDLLRGGTGADALKGGLGDDTYFADQSDSLPGHGETSAPSLPRRPKNETGRSGGESDRFAANCRQSGP